MYENAILDIIRSYLRENTRSHQNSEVKRVWASLVLPSVTRWESEVAYVFFLHGKSTDERVRRETLFFGAPKRTKIDSPRKQNKRLAQRRGEPSQAFALLATRRDETSAAGREGDHKIESLRNANTQNSFRSSLLFSWCTRYFDNNDNVSDTPLLEQRGDHGDDLAPWEPAQPSSSRGDLVKADDCVRGWPKPLDPRQGLATLPV